MRKLAIHVADTATGKLQPEGFGLVDATYAPLASCPENCALRGGACYAMNGNVRLHAGRLDQEVRGEGPADLARAEAAAIDGAYKGGKVPPGRMLRIHISGDCRTPKAASIIADAAKRWIRRGGGKVWSFTHCWKDVPRESWGAVSVLGSTEKLSDVPAILAQGYAPALVVADLPRKPWKAGGIQWIPCPSILNKAVTCSSCRKCLDADSLRGKGQGIAFGAHGAGRKKLLVVLDNNLPNG